MWQLVTQQEPPKQKQTLLTPAFLECLWWVSVCLGVVHLSIADQHLPWAVLNLATQNSFYGLKSPVTMLGCLVKLPDQVLHPKDGCAVEDAPQGSGRDTKLARAQEEFGKHSQETLCKSWGCPVSVVETVLWAGYLNHLNCLKFLLPCRRCSKLSFNQMIKVITSWQKSYHLNQLYFVFFLYYGSSLDLGTPFTLSQAVSHCDTLSWAQLSAHILIICIHIKQVFLHGLWKEKVELRLMLGTL